MRPEFKHFICQLRNSAGQAGDLCQVAICDVALGDEPNWDLLSLEEQTRVQKLTREQAQKICEKL